MGARTLCVHSFNFTNNALTCFGFAWDMVSRWVHPGQKAGPGRGAIGRTRIEPLETHSLAGESIDIRGFVQSPGLRALELHLGPTQIVGHNEDDIGASRNLPGHGHGSNQPRDSGQDVNQSRSRYPVELDPVEVAPAAVPTVGTVHGAGCG